MQKFLLLYIVAIVVTSNCWAVPSLKVVGQNFSEDGDSSYQTLTFRAEDPDATSEKASIFENVEVSVTSRVKSTWNPTVLIPDEPNDVVGFNQGAAYKAYAMVLLWISDAGAIHVVPDLLKCLPDVLKAKNQSTDILNNSLYIQEIKGHDVTLHSVADSTSGDNLTIKLRVHPEGAIELLSVKTTPRSKEE